MANEKRNLIDRDDLIDSLGVSDMEIFAKEVIGDATTVDAVEVTRCKDCRHFVQGEPYDPCECMKWKVKFGVAYTEPNGYCHKAERKDND